MSDRYCEFCDDRSGGCIFPYYGVAPHRCGYHDGIAIGGSVELPESEWPENFKLDPECGPLTESKYPRAGIYTHCLHCGAD